MKHFNWLPLVLIVVPSMSAFSLFPKNLMLEAGNEKVPVYYNVLTLLRSSLVNTSVYNINLATVIIIVLFNAMLGKVTFIVHRNPELELF